MPSTFFSCVSHPPCPPPPREVGCSHFFVRPAAHVLPSVPSALAPLVALDPFFVVAEWTYPPHCFLLKGFSFPFSAIPARPSPVVNSGLFYESGSVATCYHSSRRYAPFLPLSFLIFRSAISASHPLSIPATPHPVFSIRFGKLYYHARLLLSACGTFSCSHLPSLFSPSLPVSRRIPSPRYCATTCFARVCRTR